MITAFFFYQQTLYAYPPSAMPAFVALFPILFYDAFLLAFPRFRHYSTTAGQEPAPTPARL
jgi:hypothetical protein